MLPLDIRQAAVLIVSSSTNSGLQQFPLYAISDATVFLYDSHISVKLSHSSINVATSNSCLIISISFFVSKGIPVVCGANAVILSPRIQSILGTIT